MYAHLGTARKAHFTKSWNMKNNDEIYMYHKNRTILDLKFIVAVFDKDERGILKELQNKFPGRVIRMPNSDLIAAGFISGIGGSVPFNEDITND